MQKTNWIKRGAVAAVAAGLMLGALPGVAMAEAYNQDTTILEKTYKGAIPSKDGFTFTFAYNSNLSSKQGTNKLVYNGEVTFTKNLKPENGWTTDSKAGLKFNEVFTASDFAAPGQYVFDVTENDVTGGVVTKDTAHWLIVVNVSWQDGYPAANGNNSLVIRDVKAYKGESLPTEKSGQTGIGAGKENAASFVNNAAADLGELRLTKMVSGTAANTADVFEFTVTLTGANLGDRTYSATVDHAPNDQSASFNLTQNKDDKGNIVSYSATVKLSHDSTVKIPNLPQDVSWTIVETKDNSYEDTKVSGGKDGALEKNEGLQPVSDTVVKHTAMGTVTKGDKDFVVYTNENGFIPNTGITANSLPFVGVAAVAAAGAVTLVISRKRRAGEEF